MTYRAVFFDAGETLLHPAPSFPELFAGIVTREGHPREPLDVHDGLHVISQEFGRAAREHELWTTSPERSRRFWLGVYDRFFEVLDIPRTNGLGETLYREFTDLGNYEAFEDAAPMLEQLHDAGLTLGIISNFEPWLEDLLDHLELARFFSLRVISGIEGVEKPDPLIFRLALDRAGIDPGSAVYVGDAPDLDVEPAAALGLFPVLIDRRERHPAHQGARVTDLRRLPGLLGVTPP